MALEPELAWIALIGLAGGLAGGMLGIGGSTVMIPSLTLLYGPEHQHLHQAVGMIVTFFVVSASLHAHHRAKAIHAAVVWRMLPGALVLVLVGVRVTEWSGFRGVGQAYLAALFGFMLAGIAASELHRLAAGRGAVGGATGKPQRTGGAGWPYLIGAIAGFMGGLTGVGGGFVAVPLQRRLLDLPLRTAIANSAAMIVALSVVGAAYKNWGLVTRHGYEIETPVRLALALIPSAVLGSVLGSRLTHVLPVRLVHGVFVAFLALVAVRLMIYPFR